MPRLAGSCPVSPGPAQAAVGRRRGNWRGSLRPPTPKTDEVMSFWPAPRDPANDHRCPGLPSGPHAARAARRVRQYRQSDAGPGQHTSARSRDPRRARRGAMADRLGPARGERAAGRGGGALGVALAVWGTNAIRAVPFIGAFPIRFQTRVDGLGLAVAGCWQWPAGCGRPGSRAPVRRCRASAGAARRLAHHHGAGCATC